MLITDEQPIKDQDVHQKVLETTLDAAKDNDGDVCVICLDTVTEKAIAKPCGHDNFDFLCLASWVQEKTKCPLCKAVITAIHYGDSASRPKVYHIPQERPTKTRGPSSGLRGHSSGFLSCLPSDPTPSWVEQFRAGRPRRPYDNRKRRRQPSPPPSEDEILQRRRRIYELNLYSLHVGSNRLSGYSDLTPARFSNDPHLLSRARKWIRRELQVFDPYESTGIDPRRDVKRWNASRNAEFLLDYIVAILKTVDIKGSKGQAQEMLTDFLGDKAPLFLHELGSWLRSPFEELAVWDRNVRYEWPEGEQPRSVKRSRAESGTDDQQHRERSKQRRVDRWVPD